MYTNPKITNSQMETVRTAMVDKLLEDETQLTNDKSDIFKLLM
jgi:hypothetical protein